MMGFLMPTTTGRLRIKPAKLSRGLANRRKYTKSDDKRSELEQIRLHMSLEIFLVLKNNNQQAPPGQAIHLAQGVAHACRTACEQCETVQQLLNVQGTEEMGSLARFSTH